MTINTPHSSTINKNRDENDNPVYTSNDPMMPKPPPNLMMKKSGEKNNKERIIITKEKQR